MVVEMHAAVVSANLPCLAPLFPCLRGRGRACDKDGPGTADLTSLDARVLGCGNPRSRSRITGSADSIDQLIGGFEMGDRNTSCRSAEVSKVSV